MHKYYPQFVEALLKLSKLQEIDNGQVEESLKRISEEVAGAIEVDRVSVWFLNSDGSAIECANLYEKQSHHHSSGSILLSKDFPKYFKYLNEERILATSDATTHPVTDEFNDIYLLPLGVVSMLDAPVRVHGKMIGVICCETIGRKKEWISTEEIFVSNISDYISRAIQARERVKALEKLSILNSDLERLVEMRTRELEDQKERALLASKMALLGEMSGAIAHEINNPLAIFIGFLKVLKEAEGEESPEFRLNIIKSMEDTALRIEKIIKGLRFFARDSKLDDLFMAPVSQIIEDTLSLCKQRCKIQNCEIILDIDPDIYIFCQPVSISQALMNLISNSLDAIEYKDEKWIKISCHENEMIEFIISDSGDGISTEELGNVLSLFYTTKPPGKGSGLGLPIVKGIVENHNGSFEIDNSKEHTRFIMKFPKYKKECA